MSYLLPAAEADSWIESGLAAFKDSSYKKNDSSSTQLIQD